MREPQRLPRTVKIDDLRTITSAVSKEAAEHDGESPASQSSMIALRNGAIIELLIATGIRISELCNLNAGDYDSSGKVLRVMGKRSKERVIPIGAEKTRAALERYLDTRSEASNASGQTVDAASPFFKP